MHVPASEGDVPWEASAPAEGPDLAAQERTSRPRGVPVRVCGASRSRPLPEAGRGVSWGQGSLGRLGWPPGGREQWPGKCDDRPSRGVKKEGQRVLAEAVLHVVVEWDFSRQVKGHWKHCSCRACPRAWMQWRLLGLPRPGAPGAQTAGHGLSGHGGGWPGRARPPTPAAGWGLRRAAGTLADPLHAHHHSGPPPPWPSAVQTQQGLHLPAFWEVSRHGQHTKTGKTGRSGKQLKCFHSVEVWRGQRC